MLKKTMATFQTSTEAFLCGWTFRDRNGQDITEYVLVSGLVASAAVALIPDLFSITGNLVQMIQDMRPSATH